LRAVIAAGSQRHGYGSAAVRPEGIVVAVVRACLIGGDRLGAYRYNTDQTDHNRRQDRPFEFTGEQTKHGLLLSVPSEFAERIFAVKTEFQARQGDRRKRRAQTMESENLRVPIAFRAEYPVREQSRSHRSHPFAAPGNATAV
jgi:hypothetical protein